MTTAIPRLTQNQVPVRVQPWLDQVRTAALERGASMQWPLPSQEEFRRTDLTDFPFDSYAVPAQQFQSRAIPRLFHAQGMLFDNNTLVTRPHEIAGVRIATFNILKPEQAQGVSDLLLGDIRSADNRLIVWHYESLADGVLVEIEDDASIAEPIVIEWHVHGGNALVAPHVVVRIGKGSKATVVIGLFGRSGESLCVNAIIQSQADEGSDLTLVTAQDLPLTTTLFSHATVESCKDAVVRTRELHLGTGKTKTRTICTLNGAGSDLDVKGLYFSINQHLDMNVILRHAVEQANSRCLYKGAVDKIGHSVFQGLIEVSPGSRRTDAYLSNRNLLLSDAARADSIPCLRIANNDVKCSHGSATGKLNQEELFYLQSRGLTPDEARSIIVNGFFSEVTCDLPTSVQTFALERIAQKTGIASSHSEWVVEEHSHA